jgi:hypothetical protein
MQPLALLTNDAISGSMTAAMFAEHRNRTINGVAKRCPVEPDYLVARRARPVNATLGARRPLQSGSRRRGSRAIVSDGKAATAYFAAISVMPYMPRL